MIFPFNFCKLMMASMILHVTSLMTGAYNSVKSTPGICKYPHATNLVQKTPLLLQPGQQFNFEINAFLSDAQAAAESADSMHSTVMGGANFVLHSAGWLEGGLTTGYEKLLIDADRLGGYQKLLGGLNLDDNSIGKTAYDDVEPAGHFLGSAHTLSNYETAYYDAVMSNSDSFEQWEDDGAKDTERRAFERWQQMLKDYEAPPIDQAKDEELQAYVARKKESMADAWY